MNTPRETLTAMVRRLATARPGAPALTLGERTSSFSTGATGTSSARCWWASVTSRS